MAGRAWTPRIEKLEAAASGAGLRDVRPLLVNLVTAYNASVVASMLDVDRSQVSRWLAERDPISDEMSARVAAAHSVIVRAHQVLSSANVGPWLLGSEPLLGGARPLDALALRGAGAVLDALDGIEDGIYA